MALAIDSSTPSTVTSSTTAATTASFTPPSGSVLLVLFSANTGAGNNPAAPTITDNLGTHLTYTLIDHSRKPDTPSADGQAASWWATVATSATMTVTVTSADASTGVALKVFVLTGADTTTPIGAHGKSGSVSASAINQSYTAQSTGGQGFLADVDWDAKGTQTAGSGTTITAGDSGSVSTQISYGFARRTSADDSNGASNTVNVNIPTTSTNLRWVYAEVNPTSGPAPADAAPIPFVAPGLIAPGGRFQAWGGVPLTLIKLTNNFDGGSNGTAITTGNSGGSSGNAFDVVVAAPGDGTLAFDNSANIRNVLGLKLETTTTSGNPSVSWTTSMGSQTEIYGRTYFRFGNLPASNTRILNFMLGGTQCASLVLRSTGALSIRNTSGTDTGTSTTTLSTNTLYRIEWHYVFGVSTGAADVRIYTSPESTSIAETVSVNSQSFGAATADTYLFGLPAASATRGPYYFDDIELNNYQWPGPAAPITSPDQNLAFVGIQDDENLGFPTTSSTYTITPASIQSSETSGTATVAAVYTVSPSGIPSNETMGNVTLSSVANIAPYGVPSTEQVSQITVSSTYTITTNGIPSTQALGNPSVANVSTIAPIGISSQEILGYPTVSSVASIAPYGLSSNEKLGISVVTLNITPIGISSSEASGFHTVANVSTLAPVGLSSNEALGNVSVSSIATVSPTGITSSEVSGVPVLTLNVIAIGIASGERLGGALVAPVISPLGIPSPEVFGNPTVTHTLPITGIPSNELVGYPTVSQPVSGGFTVVQDWVTNTTGTNTSPTNVSVSLGATATSGNTLLVIVNSDATVNTPSGYTVLNSSIHNAGCYVFGKISNGTETGVTVTPTVAAATCVAMAEFSGMSGATITNQLDQTSSNGTSSGISTLSTGTTGTTVQNDEYALAVWGYSASQGTLANGGGNVWTSETNGFVEKVDIGTTKATGTNVGLALASLVFTSTQTAESTASWTPPATSAESMMTTFKITVGAAAQGVTPQSVPGSEQSGYSAVFVSINPIGVDSSEKFGNQSITLNVTPFGIPSGESSGYASVTLGGGTQTVTPYGVPSREALGNVVTVLNITPASIPTQESLGTVTTALNVTPTGIPTQEQTGYPATTPVVAPIGISSSERLGYLTVANVVTLSPYGIQSSERVAQPAISLNVTTYGITSAEAFGYTSVGFPGYDTGYNGGYGTNNQTISPIGITAPEVGGYPSVTAGAVTITPAGIRTSETLGSPTILLVTTISPYGVPSAERLGTPSITHTLALTGISSIESFGNPTAVPGAVTVAPYGLPSNSEFGYPSISLVTTISPFGIPTNERTGYPSLSLTIAPQGIVATTSFGNLTITTGAVTLSPRGIPSSEEFGLFQLTQTGPGAQIIVKGIVSESKVGQPVIFKAFDIQVKPTRNVNFPNVDNVINVVPTKVV